MSRCAECGFDWEALGRVEAVSVLWNLGRRYRAPLTRFLPGEDAEALLVSRPEPELWSALEYAAHTRDTLEFYGDRIRRSLTEERPQLSAVDFDRLTEEAHYGDEDPVVVIERIEELAGAMASELAELEPRQWDRPAIGSEGDERTVLVLARRAAHEGEHHLLDIGRVLRRVQEAGLSDNS